MKELMTAGLLNDLGTVVEVENIDDFLPPEGQRAENLLAGKRKNQAAYRRRKCEDGQHSKDCPKDCPVKVQRVAARVAGNAGSGRDGPGSTKTEGRVHPWLPGEFSDENEYSSAAAPHDSAAAEGGMSVRTDVSPPTPSQTRKRVHDGTNPNGSGVQHTSVEVHLQSQATDRNAREAPPVTKPSSRREPRCSAPWPTPGSLPHGGP
jgi:hypothetical protein